MWDLTSSSLNTIFIDPRGNVAEELKALNKDQVNERLEYLAFFINAILEGSAFKCVSISRVTDLGGNIATDVPSIVQICETERNQETSALQNLGNCWCKLYKYWQTLSRIQAGDIFMPDEVLASIARKLPKQQTALLACTDELLITKSKTSKWFPKNNLGNILVAYYKHKASATWFEKYTNGEREIDMDQEGFNMLLKTKGSVATLTRRYEHLLKSIDSATADSKQFLAWWIEYGVTVNSAIQISGLYRRLEKKMPKDDFNELISLKLLPTIAVDEYLRACSIQDEGERKSRLFALNDIVSDIRPMDILSAIRARQDVSQRQFMDLMYDASIPLIQYYLEMTASEEAYELGFEDGRIYSLEGIKSMLTEVGPAIMVQLAKNCRASFIEKYRKSITNIEALYDGLIQLLSSTKTSDKPEPSAE